MGIYCKSVAIILILFLYVFIGENGNLGHKSQQWLYDFVLLGGLIGNTYSSFTLAKGEETLIANGTGVYYVSNSYLDSVSSLVVINYDNSFILGEKDYRIKYRVQESKLYATALLGEESVRVRNIAHK